MGRYQITNRTVDYRCEYCCDVWAYSKEPTRCDMCKQSEMGFTRIITERLEPVTVKNEKVKA